ncbi:sigma-54-dependent Fis family transcriptional regulator [Clostridiisalibacter paucivorans]|uniref:sigma-54-dependent Fis family transcriptional regulator n=1 Tax=Clostridiisalibacter paucivorans TaxID=408753 RepID=UPI00047DF96D|nr:sigma-54-dependent Fis family transcriptional regulator [Clostridiisalibacter paucivorans]
MNQYIRLIAPHRKLKDISDSVIKNKGLYKETIDTVVGDLSTGVIKAVEAKKEGIEIIITRGGTATLIKNKVDIPVVEIKVTGYDLLRALKKYIGTHKKIAVIGYSNVITGARSIGEILGLDICWFKIDKESEAIDKVNDAINLGVEVVVGDTISVMAAKSKGLEHRFIMSGKEAVINAIEEAIKIHEISMREREKSKRLKAILDFSHEGIMSVDSKGVVNVYNTAAEKIFNKPYKEVIGKPVKDIIPNTRLPEVLKSGEMELGRIQKINDNMNIAVNRVPIIIKNEVRGAVTTFQDITKIQELEQKIRKEIFKRGLIARHTFQDILGVSQEIKRIIKLAKKYAKIDSTVLILGKSGTGKELFAQSIHNYSNRKKGPFVAINCAALPSNLLESELFGYVEGAFTGARRGGKQGLFEIAHNGTIFLDEIGEMDAMLQARILRVIQEREVMRIGDDKLIPINVRIITATNKDLKEEVINGNFREDLYYRLNVLNLKIPQLKDRKEDIKILVDLFLNKFSKKYGTKVKEIDNDMLEFFQQYDWPGNIRELQNVIEKISVISDTNIAKKEDLDIIIRELCSEGDNIEHQDVLLQGTLKDIEKRILIKVLKEENYNKTKAAMRLGIDRGTINRKLKN